MRLAFKAPVAIDIHERHRRTGGRTETLVDDLDGQRIVDACEAAQQHQMTATSIVGGRFGRSRSNERDPRGSPPR